MHSTSNNIRFELYSDVNKAIDELFESLRLRHQRNLESLTRGIDFFLFSSTYILQMS